jgi:hypothetical protein
MTRFYTEISKEVFLARVKTLMESEDFPYELPSQIEKDLSKVNFDWENFTNFNETISFASYPVGYRELKPGFHVFFVNAGGDWEFPVCFIFYWGDGKLRAYIPEDGNAWNKREKCAYGSEEYDNMKEDIEEDAYEYAEEIVEENMIDEILTHITKK